MEDIIHICHDLYLEFWNTWIFVIIMFSCTKFQSFEFKKVILDCQLNKMDGWSTYKHMLECF